MNILQQIFNDHFNTLTASDITIRDTVFENVEKMLRCGDYDYGFATLIDVYLIASSALLVMSF